MITRATSVTRETCETVTFGCAWNGCLRPVAWCETHHITHWADGGDTNGANLILLCRFHHGRVHTPGWTVTKTGPGRALIVHHDHPVTGTAACEGATGKGGNGTASAGQASATGADDCGCSDWRTDSDMDTAHAGDAKSFFPTGLYPTEWSEAMGPDLEQVAAQVKEARDYFEFGARAAAFDPRGADDIGLDEGQNRLESKNYRIPTTDPPPVLGERASADDLIPF